MSFSPASESVSTRQWSGEACQTRIRVTPSSSGVTLEKAGSEGSPKVALLSA